MQSKPTTPRPKRLARNQYMDTPTLLDRVYHYAPERPPGGCWEWRGNRQPTGYGHIWTGTTTALAHRVSFSIHRGCEIPEGMELDHLCRNRACINPDHLEIVTPRENTLRGEGVTAQNARKTHCPKGHLLSGDNLYVRTFKGAIVGRTCRACGRAWKRAKKLRQRGGAG